MDEQFYRVLAQPVQITAKNVDPFTRRLRHLLAIRSNRAADAPAPPARMVSRRASDTPQLFARDQRRGIRQPRQGAWLTQGDTRWIPTASGGKRFAQTQFSLS
ncbi:hypothetical protein [Bradyrhizobium sp. BWC-3-1]|uniref:hypothetical protein n=1 Tax=Bradyrhizobium sp. BWC-3-1 TaxID=3080012 RepID=UPI00293F2F8A|nr:hypothetical protein [Bradyrhizobium sp. BWC-3-1]WOH60254.1 hypothetical protein RX329_09150 [Bradyrhizobium sp. BWC-3-1]